MSRKREASDTDSDDDDDAQMRMFLEAADHTLLTNDMFNKQTETQPASVEKQKKLPKSERYLEDQDTGTPSSDLHVTKEMQTHLWGKLHAIIQNQIEYFEPESGTQEEESEDWLGGVKLLASDDGYIVDDLPETPGPLKKPVLKRRLLPDEAEPLTKDAAFAAVAVSGESILKGQDMQSWVPRKSRTDKYFEYRACDAPSQKLKAIGPTNEFTALRRKNVWNESKISQKLSNKKSKD